MVLLARRNRLDPRRRGARSPARSSASSSAAPPNSTRAQALEGRRTQPAVAPAPRHASKITEPADTSSVTDYALVNFGAPAQYHYAAVAGNGTWALLNSRSMVHYAGTPNPGQQGNVIIAFHREPDFQYINQLNVGDTITIQNRTCQTLRLQGHQQVGPRAEQGHPTRADRRPRADDDHLRSLVAGLQPPRLARRADLRARAELARAPRAGRWPTPRF